METQTRSEVIRRLKTIEGCVRGVIQMVEADRPCAAVLHQTRAVQGSLKQVTGLLLSQHIDVCLHELWGDEMDNTQLLLRDELHALFAQRE